MAHKFLLEWFFGMVTGVECVWGVGGARAHGEVLFYQGNFTGYLGGYKEI